LGGSEYTEKKYNLLILILRDQNILKNFECYCSFGYNGPCFKDFDITSIDEHRLCVRELTNEEFDCYILGQLMAF